MDLIKKLLRKKIADEKQADRHGDQRDHQDLKIRVAQARHIAQNADHLTVGIDHRAGDGQNALPCQRVSAFIVPDLLAVDGLLDLGRRGERPANFP